MAATTKDQNSDAGLQVGPAIQAQVLGQFIKDLSFENPNVGKLGLEPGEQPDMNIEVNVHARRVGQDVYESAIDFKAKASSRTTSIFVFEMVYAGLFKLENVPPQALEPFLLINCPTLLFPFLRRIAADITREGGFPPLLLDPIDFAALYVHRQQELSKSAEKQ